MKRVEIYFRDLDPVVQMRILERFNTCERDENWEIDPIAILERLDDEELAEEEAKSQKPVKQNDRVTDWQRFSRHMQEYIRKCTLKKYSLEQCGTVDLISISDSRICIWNVLKYALRNLNGQGKEHDIEKIAHYASLAWILSNQGEITEQAG